jgi:spoIIIJ-associated protein
VSETSGTEVRGTDSDDDVAVAADRDGVAEPEAGTVLDATDAGADAADGAAAGADDDSDADEADDSDDETVDAAGGAAAAPSKADLFRESEIAADYVEGLLDILDYDGDIDELVSAGRPMVEVVGGRLNSLVGTRGATLEALQELARLAVFRQTGSPSRLLLDVGGYRATRRKELGAIAKNAAEKVKEFGEPVRLEAMSAFERKCVHDVINALAGVESESEGVEPSRRIVVRPAP